MSPLTHIHEDIANIFAWIAYLDSQREQHMAYIEDLAISLDAANASVDRAIAEIASLRAKVAAPAIEDPRMAHLAEQAAAIFSRLDAIVPAPNIPAPDHPPE